MPFDPFVTSLIAGSAAGTSVDVALFPLDTLKTRLQSRDGFWGSGGFRGIYRGIGPAFLGSAPNAAVFFCTYDTTKRSLKGSSLAKPFVHMLSASLGETMACIVRVPVEILKQRRQVSSSRSVPALCRQILSKEGVAGFYRGYGSTLLREIPFSLIQFPLWEALKGRFSGESENSASALTSSLCGAVSGAIAAALTTPLDVAKTRIMLAEAGSLEATGGILPVLGVVYRERGLGGLFSGLLPRVLWISVGGSIFFGSYELVKSYIS